MSNQPERLERDTPKHGLRQPFGMTRWRMAVVQLGLFVIVGGSLFDVVTQREHWPFSPYPMYSKIELDSSTTKYYVYGVPAAGSGHRADEISLQSFAYTAPLSTIRLGSGLSKLQWRNNRDELLQRTLRDLLARYERLRLAGRHPGPPLQSIRLYQEEWLLDPWARNLDQPDRRALLIEVTAAQ